MSDWLKSIDAMLRAPGYIIAGVFLFSLFAVFLLPNQLADWPTSWPSLSVTRLLIELLAALCGALLLAKILVSLGNVLVPLLKKRVQLAQLRAVVAALPDSGKAALRVVADRGQIQFYAEPNQEYVDCLKKAGLVSVVSADRLERWGLFKLTLDGISITRTEYRNIHDMLDIPTSKLASIQGSMNNARQKAPQI